MNHSSIRSHTLSFCHLLVAAVLCQTPAGAQLAHPDPADGDARWATFAKTLEVKAEAGNSGYSFDLNRGGGTSVYVKIVKDGRPIGAILPENSATSIEGEITSFRLARYLGFPELSQPAVPFRIKGSLLASFRSQLAGSSFGGQKESNRQNVLVRIKANPDGIYGVCKQWQPAKPVAIESLVTSGAPNGKLNTSHPVAAYLQRTGPMPSPDPIKLREFPGAPTPALTLARQFSNLMVADALAGQWDRFSGGNIQGYTVNGQVRITALDNGGASLASGSRYGELFKGWVTRFDPQTVKRLAALDDFLQGKSSSLEGHRTPADMIAALGFSERNGKLFSKRVANISAHLKACASQPGGVFPAR